MRLTLTHVIYFVLGRLIQNATLISEANRTICAQRMLDPTFEDISNATYALTNNNFHVTAWSYFGSVEGIQRSFPGRVSGSRAIWPQYLDITKSNYYNECLNFRRILLLIFAFHSYKFTAMAKCLYVTVKCTFNILCIYY